MGNNERNIQQFKIIFDNYFSALVLFAERYLSCRVDSESVVQDAFISLWEKSLVFENEVATKSYLYTTVRNMALNVLKHRKVEALYINKALEEESEMYYMKSLIEEETRRLIFQAVESLPEHSRRICLLHLEGLDNQNISEIMNISVDTVKFHKKNAYRILREKLREHFYLFF